MEAREWRYTGLGNVRVPRSARSHAPVLLLRFLERVVVTWVPVTRAARRSEPNLGYFVFKQCQLSSFASILSYFCVSHIVKSP
jgi:hypothetical protein